MALDTIARALSILPKSVGAAAAVTFPALIFADGRYFSLPQDWLWAVWGCALFFSVLCTVWIIELIAVKLEALRVLQEWLRKKRNRSINGAEQYIVYVLSLRPSEYQKINYLCELVNNYFYQNYSYADIQDASAVLEKKGLILRDFQFGTAWLTDEGVSLSREVQGWFELLDINLHKL